MAEKKVETKKVAKKEEATEMATKIAKLIFKENPSVKELFALDNDLFFTLLDARNHKMSSGSSSNIYKIDA